MPMYLASRDLSMSSGASSRTNSLPPIDSCHIWDTQSPASNIMPERARGIHSLPFEVLTRIFVLGANYAYPFADSPFLIKPDAKGSYYSPPSCEFQVAVSQTCSLWRRLTLDTPVLWSMVHFRRRGDIERGKQFVTRCENRPKPYPIDILIETVDEDEYSPPHNLYETEMDDIFTFLQHRREMWRSLHLKVRCDSCKLVARKHIKACKGASLLETLQLYHFEDFRDTEGLDLATVRRPVVCFNNNLPSLKNVSMVGVNLPWEVSPYVTKLHHLEMALHRGFTRPAFKDWRSIVYESPDLQSLSILFSGPMPPGTHQPFPAALENDWPRENEKPVALERLERLALIDPDSPDYLCSYIRFLAFPAVKQLILGFDSADDYTSFFQLASGTYRSIDGSYRLPSPLPCPDNLQSLTLTEFDCEQAALEAFLSQLTGLRVLEVGDVPDHFVNALVKGLSVQVCLPGTNITRGGGGFAAAHGADISTSGLINGDVSGGTDTTRIVPMLPKLQTLKSSWLTGAQIMRFIRHREIAGPRLPMHKDDGCSPTYGIRKLLVGYNESRKGKDRALDKIVSGGLPDILVETFEEEFTDDGEDDDYEGGDDNDEGGGDDGDGGDDQDGEDEDGEDEDGEDEDMDDEDGGDEDEGDNAAP